MRQTRLEIAVSPGLLGAPPLASARGPGGDGQNLGPATAMGLTRTPRSGLRVGSFGDGGLWRWEAGGRCGVLGFHWAFHAAVLLPGSEHEDAGGCSSTSGLSK